MAGPPDQNGEHVERALTLSGDAESWFEGSAMPTNLAFPETGSTAMNVLRVVLVAVAIGSAGVSGASAQAPATVAPAPEALQAAKDLLALISPRTIADMTSNVTARVWPQMEAALRQQYPTIDQATLGELRGAYEHLVTETVTDAMTEAPALYARYFTAAEMNQIATFYRTPAGAKALTIMPKVTGDLVPILLPRMQRMQGNLGAIFGSVLKRHGYEQK